MQKTLLANFPALTPEEWSIQHLTANCIMISNRFTSDQFTLDEVCANTSHLHDIYLARALYSIPNTPQIILPQAQVKAGCIQMLVQMGPLSLESVLSKNSCQCSLEEVLRNLLKTVECLVRKFGFFKLTDQMIKVSKSHSLLVWIHENFNSTHRQFPLGSPNLHDDCKTMAKDFLGVLEKSGYKNQLYKLKDKIDAENAMTFEKFRSILDSHFRCKDSASKKAIKNYRSPEFLKRRSSPLKHLDLPKDQHFQKLEDHKSLKNIHHHLCESSGPTEIKLNLESDGDSRNKIRDSSNTVSTTTFFSSIASSGKIKHDEHNFMTPQKREHPKSLVLSAGVQESRRLKDAFQVKASKIIQEKSEEQAINMLQSHIKEEHRVAELANLADLENEMGGLLESQSQEERSLEDIPDFEKEFQDLLEG